MGYRSNFVNSEDSRSIEPLPGAASAAVEGSTIVLAEDDRLMREHTTAMLRIKRLHDQVSTARARLEQVSLHDELTGLYNYRYLHSRLSEEFKRAERYHEPLACLVADIDRLREHNEASGRGAGDQVLRDIAECFRRGMREMDVVARFGGDELLVLLPSTHFAGSVTAAERLWREVAEHVSS